MKNSYSPDTFITEKPGLLDEVRYAIRTKHCSRRTEEAYMEWIKRFIFFHNKRDSNEISAGETYMRNLVKADSGTRTCSKKAWEICYQAIVELELTERMIEEE